MGLGELNFDLGFVGFIIALGPPVFLLVLIATLPDEISDNIEKWKDARRTKEESMEAFQRVWDRQVKTN